MNILDTRFETPFNTAPFSKIKTDAFLPAFRKAIESAKNEINQIVENKATPSFENTIEALDYTGEQLDRISSIFFNLNAAETNEEIQKTAQEVSPLLTEFSNDVALNTALFERVKSVYNTKESLSLTEEQKTLLDKKYKGFSRNGANLSNDQKEVLRSIDKEQSQLKLTFGENILAETNRYELLISELSDLDGLPEGAIEAAKQLAEEKDKKGWLITLDNPSYIPFMTYAKNRVLRKELALAFGQKGFKNDNLDNQEIVLKIAQLRYQRAQLLGYLTHAHFVLEERMAKTPENAMNLMDAVWPAAIARVKEEVADMQAVADKNGDNITIEPWDYRYYAEKVRVAKYDLNSDEVKQYLQLDKLREAMFYVAGRLFNYKFEPVPEGSVAVFQEDVKVWEVTDLDSGAHIGLWYLDPFARACYWLILSQPNS